MNCAKRLAYASDASLKASPGLAAAAGGDGAGWIEGYLAVYGNVDMTREIIAPGCFAVSVALDVPAGKIPLMVKHAKHGGDVPEVIGTISQAREDDTGLWIHADLSRTQIAQDTRTKVAEGSVKGLSVGFISAQNHWETRGGNQVLVHDEGFLLEGTVTAFPVNREAQITAAKGIRTVPANAVDFLRTADITIRRLRLRRLELEASRLPDDEPEGDEDSFPSQEEIEAMRGKTLTADERAFRGKVIKYLAGEERVAQDQALQAKAAGFGDSRGVAMPPGTVDIILGKALPLTEDAVGYEMRPDFSPVTRAGPVEGRRLVPLCRLVPNIPSRLEWSQPKADEKGEEGGPKEFAEYAGIGCDWSPEGVEAPDFAPDFERMEILTHRLEGYTEATHTLISRSGGALPEALAMLWRPAFQLKLERAILRGNGLHRPLGILATEGVKTFARAVGNQVSFADLLGMEDQLPVWLQERSVWVIGKVAFKYLKGLAETGTALWLEEFTESGYKQLLGHPILPSDALPDLGTEGDVVFGDFSFYVMPIEREVQVESSAHFKFREGVICFAGRMLAGGRAVQPRAFVKLAVPA
jgi:HK97 family phage major capsid protein/HK97 family phage prohead protease